MISRAEATGQIMRLSAQQDFSKTTPEGIQELAEVLRSSARNLDHAKDIITRLRTDSRWMPPPIDIINLAREDQAAQPQPRREHCPVCEGTAWMRAWELHTGSGRRKTVERITEEQYHDLLAKVSGRISDQIVTECVERCTECKYGRSLIAARDAEEHAA